MNKQNKNIKPSDYVKGISGPFKNKSGWVSRIDADSACVVWTGVWDHGIWTDFKHIKRTKRFKNPGCNI